MTRRNKRMGFVVGDHAVAGIEEVCRAGWSWFAGLEGAVVTKGRHGQRIFLPGADPLGASRRVLAVCHLDYVCHADKLGWSFADDPYGGSGVITSQALDDRAGAWSLLFGLPRLLGSRPYDILFTMGEETGNSTAMDYKWVKGVYGWMFSMDRRGADAVVYGYQDEDWMSRLTDAGWDVGLGSYSCIASLEDDADCCGVNFGVGFVAEHSADCRVNLDVLAGQLWRVAHWIKCNAGILWSFDPYGVQKKVYARSRAGYDWDADWDEVTADVEDPLAGDNRYDNNEAPYVGRLQGWADDRLALRSDEARRIEAVRSCGRRWVDVDAFGKNK